MYYQVFCAVTDAVNSLAEAQTETENAFIKNEDGASIAIVNAGAKESEND